MLAKAIQPFLENLAIAVCGPAKFCRRQAGGPMKGADKVGEVCESGIKGDIGDGAVIRDEEAGGAF